jgi:hypothetical protein
MKLFSRITVAVLGLLLSAQAFASNDLFSDAVIGWAKHNVKVSLWCGGEAASIKKEFQKVVIVGMRRLHAINPTLAEARMQRRLEDQLLLVCGEPFSIGPTGQQYAMYFSGLVHHKIYLGTTKMRDYLKSENFQNGVLFHEFLHFLGFDSVSKAEHQSPKPSDAVYMCALASFPELAPISGFNSRMHEKPSFAAEICASAELVNGKVSVPKDAILRALDLK